MPGKTMVGGAAYDVVPGNVMVGGTVYTIKEGKTMVGGTAYSIKFASDVVVTITGSGSGFGESAYVTINGTKYTSEAMVTVPAGTEIYCYAKRNNAGAGGVYLNGRNLDRTSYTFNAESDVSIELSNTLGVFGYCRITTI